MMLTLMAVWGVCPEPDQKFIFQDTDFPLFFGRLSKRIFVKPAIWVGKKRRLQKAHEPIFTLENYMRRKKNEGKNQEEKKKEKKKEKKREKKKTKKKVRICKKL